MSWIWIALLVLLAAFGPLLWLKPSAKDKRLTALRAQARALNLSVDVKPLQLLNPTAAQRVSAAGKVRDHGLLVAVYSLILPRRLQRISAFRVLRAPTVDAEPLSRPAIAVDENWYFDPEQSFPPQLAWPQSWQGLRELAAQLPADVLALALEPRAISVYWAERADSNVATVERLAATLERMATAAMALEQQLAEAQSSTDS